MTQTVKIPVVALRGLVVFPEQLLHFDVGREKSIKAVEESAAGGHSIFLVAQKHIATENPKLDDIYRYGVIAKVDQIIKIPGKNGRLIHISVRGICRARIHTLTDNGKYLEGEIVPLKAKKIRESEKEYSAALVRSTKDTFAEYSENAPRIPDDIFTEIIEMKDPGRLADFIAGNIMLEVEDRQAVLETLDPVERLEEVNLLLAEESYLLSLEADIDEKVREKMDKNQRDYYLQEQIKIISDELNGYSPEEEIEQFREKIKNLKAGDTVKEKLLKECSRLEKMSSSSPDSSVSRNYLEICTELPWGEYSEENNDIENCRRVLDRDHYGLQKVKERIIEYLAVSSIAPDIKGQILCLVGPPGVGKTSIARSVAEATGRKYVRIALGGVRDEAEIRGALTLAQCPAGLSMPCRRRANRILSSCLMRLTSSLPITRATPPRLCSKCSIPSRISSLPTTTLICLST